MKTCSKCKIEKSLEGFATDNNRKDGKRSDCKACSNEATSAYKKTKQGLVAQMYGRQRDSSRHRKHPMPDYTLDQLREWVFAQPNFEELYNNWVASGYKKDLVPSCDRLNDNLPYTLDNLRLVKFRVNYMQACEDMRNGLLFNGQTPIKCSNGKVYHSQCEAARQLGLYQTNITKVLKGRLNHTGGFTFKYANNG